MKRAALSLLILCLSTPLSAGLKTSSAPPASEKLLLPIAASPQAGDPSFVAARCRSFIDSLVMRRQILMSNPVSGRNPFYGEVFNWINASTLGEKINDEMERLDLPSAQYLQDYMDAFGPVYIPSRVPKMGLYIADK
ncbi:hypothetical protein HA397_30615, partial [Escherichia coli]|nr:hypothetical protein [Escherichia coli]